MITLNQADIDQLGALRTQARADAAQSIKSYYKIYETLAVYDDSRSLVTGKALVITRAGDTSNTITLNNFELNFREKPSNRLYIGGSLL